jgi:tetratricopeptide (TPR) repeat protein
MLKYISLALVLVLVGCSSGMYSQGRKMVEEGQYDQAIDFYYAQIKANPQDAGAWRELGIAFYEKGDLTKAEDAFKQANAIRPDARTNLYMGLVYEQQAMYGKAIDAYRASLSLNPNSKTREMIQSHLEVLVLKKVKAEAAMALTNESEIDVDTIPKNTIAVVDFDNTHLPPELAPISKGLAEFAAMDLTKVKSLRVVDRLKIEAILNELKLGESGYVDPSTAPRMGRLLGSRNLVTGTLLGIGDTEIQLDGAVVNTGDSTTKTTGPTDGDLSKFYDIEKNFVFKVIDNLGIKLTEAERDSIRIVPTESYLAFMAYSRGLDFRSQGMYEAANTQFGLAVQADKGFQDAAVQQKAMVGAAAGSEESSLQTFKTEVAGAAGQDEGGGSLDQFQSSSLLSHGFIRDPGDLDQFGNTPDSPDRVVKPEGFETIIIRGNLDAHP